MGRQWHQLDHMQNIWPFCSRQITMPAYHHPVFTAEFSSSCPTNSVKALKAIITTTIKTVLRLSGFCLGLPVWAGTRKVNQSGFPGARDSDWHWHQLGHMQICTSSQTDNHASTPPPSFLQAGCPSCRPTNSIKALKAKGNYKRCAINEMHTNFKTQLENCPWLRIEVRVGVGDLWLILTFNPRKLWSWPVHMQKVKVKG